MLPGINVTYQEVDECWQIVSDDRRIKISWTDKINQFLQKMKIIIYMLKKPLFYSVSIVIYLISNGLFYQKGRQIKREKYQLEKLKSLIGKGML